MIWTQLTEQPGDHMHNFFECVADHQQPISDVFTHYRALTTCHLANIAIRLERPHRWDPKKEVILSDEEAAASWTRREPRKGGSSRSSVRSRKSFVFLRY